MRINLFSAWPEGYTALTALDKAVNSGCLDPALLELVKLRTSQLNGCAYCIDMHTKDARVAGETEQRLYATAAWREAPFFSEDERVALALADALTHIDHDGLDQIVDAARDRFGDVGLAQLVHGIAVMNAWNRLALTTRITPGSYKPAGADTR